MLFARLVKGKIGWPPATRLGREPRQRTGRVKAGESDGVADPRPTENVHIADRDGQARAVSFYSGTASQSVRANPRAVASTRSTRRPIPASTVGERHVIEKDILLVLEGNRGNQDDVTDAAPFLIERSTNVRPGQ